MAYIPRTALSVPVDVFGPDAVISRADMLRAINAEVERRFNLQRERMRTGSMNQVASTAKKMLALAEASKNLEAAVKAEEEYEAKALVARETLTVDAPLAGVV